MYDLPEQEISEEFLACWKAAGIHLQNQVEGTMTWLKCNPNPPMLEHLSFRLANQLFFVRVEDFNEDIPMPGSLDGLLSVANGCNGFACLMPMRKIGGVWMPATAGWGLLDARDGKPINPVDFVSDELIEVSDWELQDFGVQIVRDHLQGQGKNVFNTQSNPQVNPSIWFDGPDGPEWVVVRVSRHPATKAVQPVNMADISHHCATHGGKQGYFASVVFANADDPFDPLAAENGNFIPVYRGHRAMVRFEGLEPISLERRFPSSKLCAELLSWNNALLKRGDDLPKVFSGICPDNRQFMVFMADLPIERGEHLDFMKAVLAAESAIAFCYSMHIMAKVGEGPDDLEERRDFVAGEAGHYEYVSARLVDDDAREQIGLEVVTHRESEEPEWFLQALLEAGQETERYQELWRGIRDKVKWRTR